MPALNFSTSSNATNRHLLTYLLTYILCRNVDRVKGLILMILVLVLQLTSRQTNWPPHCLALSDPYCQSTLRLACMMRRTISCLTLLISRRRIELAYCTLHAAKQGLAIADVMKRVEFLSECGRTRCSASRSVLSRMSRLFNTRHVFHAGVCLKVPHGQLIRVLVAECDDFEHCDVTSMTSQSRVTSSMTSPIDAPQTLLIWSLLDTTPKWLNFRDTQHRSCRQTDRQTDTSTYNRETTGMNFLTSGAGHAAVAKIL